LTLTHPRLGIYVYTYPNVDEKFTHTWSKCLKQYTCPTLQGTNGGAVSTKIVSSSCQQARHYQNKHSLKVEPMSGANGDLFWSECPAPQLSPDIKHQQKIILKENSCDIIRLSLGEKLKKQSKNFVFQNAPCFANEKFDWISCPPDTLKLFCQSRARYNNTTKYKMMRQILL
jgi:hypothetical protein